MKKQRAHRHLDEREKLRQFRELDDAFARALREMEVDTFEQRLKALMAEYAQSSESVTRLLRTLQELGRIA
ncbi:hypothetical protein [Billgrantia gudaonensis]|uniref:Uncharacterized protein n=1 Tax=Billgrantia gudaonensis TaxID=376427 RepID=A0A1G8VFW9_9GAMM|nr:hypothetical protein [Halomonas gudaonensis]SDJ64938.1 hypothetical protein SAMN04487954_106198 [Halomonas gudaonensis]